MVNKVNPCFREHNEKQLYEAERKHKNIFKGSIENHYWSIKTGRIKVQSDWEHVGNVVALKHESTKDYEEAFTALHNGVQRLQRETGLTDGSDFLLAVELILSDEEERMAA